MAAYILKGISAAPTYNAPGFPVIEGILNIPELITNPGLLALASTPDVGLSTFAGFVQNDTVKIAKIPKGFLVLAAGLRNFGAENTTCDIGDSAGAASLWSNVSLNSATAVAISTVLSAAKVYTSEDYIIVTFDQNTTYDLAKFVVSLVGALIE